MDEPYEWRSIGGHLTLDLVNTVSWRLDPERRVDRLLTPAAVVSWATALGAVDGRQAAQLSHAIDAGGKGARDLLSQVLLLRTAVGAVLDATVDGRPPGAVAIHDARSAWEAALARAEVGPTLPLRWRVTPGTPAALVDLLALDAGDLLRSADVAQVRRCDGPGCGWLFLDTTRNHSRRWCDTADCGNRARGRRHRAKVAQGSAGKLR